MIEISPQISIDEAELQIDFIHSTGPGGQNVNKVATAAQLRFDVAHTTALPPAVKERLIRLAGKRVTAEGILIIEARRYRTQEQNRLDALQRLSTLIQKALVEPKTRRPTRPSAGARAARVDEKKRRSTVKRQRRPSSSDWE